MRIDREVGTEVIERLQPLGIEAALLAQAVRSRASGGRWSWRSSRPATHPHYNLILSRTEFGRELTPQQSSAPLVYPSIGSSFFISTG